MVHANPLSRTICSIPRKSRACWRSSQRKNAKYRPFSGNNTAADTMASRAAPLAFMASTVARAQSMTRVLGRNASFGDGPMADNTASCPGSAAAIFPGCSGSPATIVSEGLGRSF